MKTILLVDDEYDILEALAAILESDGFRVVTAGDGAEGLRVMRESHPDLAVVDLMMPVMDGLELMRAVREDEKLKNIPIILMSALRPRWSQQEYGWRAFLQKPFNLDALFAAVQEQLKG